MWTIRLKCSYEWRGCQSHHSVAVYSCFLYANRFPFTPRNVRTRTACGSSALTNTRVHVNTASMSSHHKHGDKTWIHFWETLVYYPVSIFHYSSMVYFLKNIFVNFFLTIKRSWLCILRQKKCIYIGKIWRLFQTLISKNILYIFFMIFIYFFKLSIFFFKFYLFFLNFKHRKGQR